MHPEADARARARDVDLDLVPDLLVEALAVAREGDLDEREVLLPFALERRGALRGGERDVAEEELPGHRAEVLGDAGPRNLAELG